MATPLSADRLVILALEAGVQSLLADATLFSRMLASYPAAERARMRTRFVGRRPTVRPAFARADDLWPIWAVTLGDEQVEQELLGNLLSIDPALGAHGSREIGALERQSVGVYLHCEHPEETRAHHQLAKAILRGSVPWLLQQGVVAVSYGGGRDLRPNESYLPESIFVRMQVWELVLPSVGYEVLPTPRSQVYAHLTGITVSGHAGHVAPEGE
ncbi:MAG: hypothetical protein RBU45_18915 [Myxococcota bacterium]|jgi:hypothetical protein|nr:hypothetical protein [Myxococcota bacterium]